MECCEETIQFADDITCSAIEENIEEVKTVTYCKEKALEFNVQKTRLIIFRRIGTTIPKKLNIEVPNNVLHPLDEVKILKVTLDRAVERGEGGT